MWERVLVLVWRECVRPLCPSDISPTSGGNRAAVPPLWMDVPSAEAPAFAGMTVLFAGMTEGDAGQRALGLLEECGYFR